MGGERRPCGCRREDNGMTRVLGVGMLVFGFWLLSIMAIF
jgi:hypothetical protein